MPPISACPDPACRAPAHVVDRWTLDSTHGPVDHVKTACEGGHIYTVTVDWLAGQLSGDQLRGAVVPVA